MIQIPVFNTTAATFEQTITLGDQTLQITLSWNGRGGHWYMDLHTADGTALLLGRKLVPVLPVCFSHRALVPIKGDFVLLQESASASEYPTFDGLGTTHNLYWLDDTEVDNLEVLLGIR